MDYNLLDAPWIPVLHNDGEFRYVGILEALAQAHRIREIAASNPMDRVALLRFLLAVLYWCKGNPPEVCDDSNAPFPEEWFDKLDTHRECFNLLGDGKRFYQYREPAVPTRLSVNYLAQEVPTGINSWHFRHATEGEDGLCPACCALGLVRLPAFATSGGSGKPPGINNKPPLYVLPEGATLGITLRLSWRPVPDALGTPFWEAPFRHLPGQAPVPLLVGLTWVPRQIWLDNPQEPAASCAMCGRTEALIRRCVFAKIGSAKREMGSSRIWHDYHVLYAPKKKSGKLEPANALESPDGAAEAWAETMAGLLDPQWIDRLHAAIGKCGGDPDQVRIRCVGFSTVGNDKYLETAERVMLVPAAPDPPPEAKERLEQWRAKSEPMRIALAQAESPKRKPRRETEIVARSTLAAIRQQVESLVSTQAGQLATGDETTWQAAADEYRPMMKAVTGALSPGFTTAALARRREIANLVPEMTARKGSPSGGRKKGGDQ